MNDSNDLECYSRCRITDGESYVLSVHRLNFQCITSSTSRIYFLQSEMSILNILYTP